MVLGRKHKSLWMLSQQQPMPQPIFCSEIYIEKTLNYHHLDSIATHFLSQFLFPMLSMSPSNGTTSFQRKKPSSISRFKLRMPTIMRSKSVMV